MSTAVYDILDQIRQLPSEDRNLLDRLLMKLEDAEWQAEARRARRQAKAEGVDQEAIDRALQEERYGE